MTPDRLIRAVWRHMTPAMGETSRGELLRATLGTALAIALTDILLWTLRHFTPALPGGTGDPMRELILVSPFAATAFLILTVPNSPLAQPWSVIIGNTIGCACGALCVWLLPYPVLAAATGVGLSVIAMSAVRALHPPGAAMALNAVLLHFSGTETGVAFVLATVTVGSVLLVLFGMVFNPLTGRRYPFRQANETLPKEAISLAAILERLKLSANIGVTDLSRLIAAVEAEATAHHLGHMAAGSMMTAAPFTLPPTATLPEIGAAFKEHPFRSIPVTEHGLYLGLLRQSALLDAAEDASAQSLMQKVDTVAPTAELPEVLPHLTTGRLRVLPVVEDGKLVGIITRSDLIGVLARALRGE
ncbi:HPP family protein [Thioclava sp. FR2]|uniref:HPP family protein n=1 Tax=Thioclava sp. FR2 TaxID=3445780 RepID=UPI003EB7542A